jgi:DNA repair exonuclease SbcCD nuclease subunit
MVVAGSRQSTQYVAMMFSLIGDHDGMQHRSELRFLPRKFGLYHHVLTTNEREALAIQAPNLPTDEIIGAIRITLLEGEKPHLYQHSRPEGDDTNQFRRLLTGFEYPTGLDIRSGCLCSILKDIQDSMKWTSYVVHDNF